MEASFTLQLLLDLEGFLLEGWLSAAQNDNKSFFAPLGTVCATLDNILETVQLLGV